MGQSADEGGIGIGWAKAKGSGGGTSGGGTWRTTKGGLVIAAGHVMVVTMYYRVHTVAARQCGKRIWRKRKFHHQNLI